VRFVSMESKGRRRIRVRRWLSERDVDDADVDVEPVGDRERGPEISNSSSTIERSFLTELR